MPAAHRSITVEQGATFFQRYTWEEEDGTPIPLTSHTIAMQIRETHDADVILVSLTSSPAAGIVITDAANGKFEVTIDAATTAALSDDCGVYDIEITDTTPSPDFVTRLVEGPVVVTPEVTK